MIIIIGRIIRQINKLKSITVENKCLNNIITFAINSKHNF